MYGCMDVWMDGCVCICMCVSMYIDVYTYHVNPCLDQGQWNSRGWECVVSPFGNAAISIKEQWISIFGAKILKPAMRKKAMMINARSSFHENAKSIGNQIVLKKLQLRRQRKCYYYPFSMR